MITFLIEKENVKKTFECTLEDSILSLKEQIIEEYSLQCKYIDIDFQLERPIRSLGKFNLEAGILPRPLDNYKFDHYGLDGREIKATFIEVNDYVPYKRNTVGVNLRKYNEMKEGESKGEVSYDLESMDDFPGLS